MKFLIVLFPDPQDGMPTTYARDSIPKLGNYPNGQTLPTPLGRDFTPGELLGCVSGGLGLVKWLRSEGHEVVVTSDKESNDSEAVRHLKDADVVISQPFWPFYLSEERFALAEKVKLVITAGVGSDHTDLKTALKREVTVCEVTYSNSESVAEHIVMSCLVMVRNFLECHQESVSGGWDIAKCTRRAYELKGMSYGSIASGRIGLDAMRKLKAFGVHLNYTDKKRLPESVEEELGLRYFASVQEMAREVDILNVSCPLHPETLGLVDGKLIGSMQRGSYIVNTARGGIVDREAVVAALQSGHLAGYAGDVWWPQPAPKDHPWRSMPHNAMTVHVSGAVLPAQSRYADGTREILESWLAGGDIREEYLVVKGNRLAGVGASSYTV